MAWYVIAFTPLPCMTLATDTSSGISCVFLILAEARPAHGYILLAILFVDSTKHNHNFVNRR